MIVRSACGCSLSMVSGPTLFNILQLSINPFGTATALPVVGRHADGEKEKVPQELKGSLKRSRITCRCYHACWCVWICEVRLFLRHLNVKSTNLALPEFLNTCEIGGKLSPLRFYLRTGISQPRIKKKQQTPDTSQVLQNTFKTMERSHLAVAV